MPLPDGGSVPSSTLGRPEDADRHLLAVPHQPQRFLNLVVAFRDESSQRVFRDDRAEARRQQAPMRGPRGD